MPKAAPIVPLIKQIPKMLVATSPSENVPTTLDFFETRNFAKLFGIIGVGATAVVAYLLYKKYLEQIAGKETVAVAEKLSEAEEKAIAEKLKEEENKVILYQVPRGFFTPAVAPFALKLETFMRVSNISYEVHLSTAKHEVDTPWIKIGDEEIRKNSECIGFLTKKFNIDLSKGSSNSRRTASRMVDVMLDSRVYWAIALWRWVYDGGKSMKDIQPLAPSGEAVLDNVRESVMRAAHYNGIGRLSKEEVISSVIQDLTHLNAALGKHQYFLGDSPGEVDCNAFSLLAQMVWNMPGSPFEEVVKKHKALMDFVIRMREKFWPDWDELVQHQESNDSSKISMIDSSQEQNGNKKPSATSAKSNSSIPESLSPSKGLHIQKNTTAINSDSISKNVIENTILQGSQQTSIPVSPLLIHPTGVGSQNQSNTSVQQSNKDVNQPQISQQAQHSQAPDVVLQLRNPNQVQRPSNLQVQFQQQPQPGTPMTIRDIQNQWPNNRNPNVNLTEQQLNQIQNHHHQVRLQEESQNKFQQIRDGIQDVNNQVTNAPQQYINVDFQDSERDRYNNGVYNSDGYYPQIEPAVMQESLQRAANATVLQSFDDNRNQGFLLPQSNEQNQQQYNRVVEPAKSLGYSQQGNYPTPGSNQSQIYNHYWN